VLHADDLPGDDDWTVLTTLASIAMRRSNTICSTTGTGR
jgi:hypothetical protein